MTEFVGDALERLLGEAARTDTPLTVLFELTNRCNHACRHCYVDHGDSAGELTTAEALRVLDELRAAGALFVTFSGGEIFLRRDVLTLLRRARELALAPRLFSNGVLIDEAIADAIAAIGVVEVELSVYSMNPARHDWVTLTAGSHERTVRAARLLRERGVSVCLKAPILRGMSRDYRDVLRFAELSGLHGRFDPDIVARCDGDEAPLALRASDDELRDIHADAALALAIAPDTPRPPDPAGAVCAAARRVALISARGLVFPCSQRFPPAGDLRRQSFGEIWTTSPLLLRLRNITMRDLRGCSSCGASTFCGRCFLDARQEDGDFWGPSEWAGRLAASRLAAYSRGGVTRAEQLLRRFGGDAPSCEL